MRETKKDLQDGRGEAFLLQHSSRSNSAAVSLDQVREELAKLMELAQAGAKATDPMAREFSLGNVSGLRDAMKLIEQAEQAARIKAAATSTGSEKPGGKSGPV